MPCVLGAGALQPMSPCSPCRTTRVPQSCGTHLLVVRQLPEDLGGHVHARARLPCAVRQAGRPTSHEVTHTHMASSRHAGCVFKKSSCVCAWSGQVGRHARGGAVSPEPSTQPREAQEPMLAWWVVQQHISRSWHAHAHAPPLPPPPPSHSMCLAACTTPPRHHRPRATTHTCEADNPMPLPPAPRVNPEALNPGILTVRPKGPPAPHPRSGPIPNPETLEPHPPVRPKGPPPAPPPR